MISEDFYIALSSYRDTPKRQIASSTREKAEPDFVKRDFERLLDSKTQR